MDPYTSNLPCLNPNCHSHGKPHPNCRCYGMAEGGDVGHFCSEARAHKPDCEYYMAEGGETPSWDSLSAAPPQKNEGAPDWDSLSQSPPSEKAPNWEELSSEPPQKENKYGSTYQQFLSGLEGAAQGIAGPLATLAETSLGVPKEDIKGRAEANPWTHGIAEAATLAGGLMTGVGEAGLIAKGAGAIAEAADIGRVGSAVLKGALESASFAGCDEITKSMLNQPGSDPETPVSAALLHVGAAGLMGGIAGGVFNFGEKLIGKGLESPKAIKELEKAQDFLFDLGQSNTPISDLGITKKIAGTAAFPLAMKTGAAAPVTYPIIRDTIEKHASKFADKMLGPYATDAVVRALSDNAVSGIPNAIHYANQIARGASAASKGVEALFKAGSSQIAPPISDSAREDLKNFVNDGQIDEQMKNSMIEQPNFAKGGLVSSGNQHFAKVFPEQNMLLSQAKSRISSYLNGIRPATNQPKLPFDDVLPQKEKSRSYEKAIDFAVNPMSILNHINKGDLTPEHVHHFKSLYPDVHKYLSQEMTKKITQAQLKGEKPAYSKRQAMSLFMGVELDSTFTPQAISTVQGTYAMGRGQQQQAPMKPKKSTAPLSKVSNSYLTDSQASVRRDQNQKA